MNKKGFKIRKFREAKDYTQEYMATRMNISQNVYSKLESGLLKLTDERIKQITDILEIPEDWLNADDFNVFNIYNNTYSFIENLQEHNKELINTLIKQNDLLHKEIEKLTNIIEKLSDK